MSGKGHNVCVSQSHILPDLGREVLNQNTLLTGSLPKNSGGVPGSIKLYLNNDSAFCMNIYKYQITKY